MPNTEQNIEETGGIPEIDFELEVSGMTQAAVDKTLSIPDMAADAKATGDAIAAVSEDIADVGSDVADILNWTGEDIPINSEDGAPSIAEAVAAALSTLYPIGSLYITTADALPDMISSTGTWQEVRIPLTWNDVKNGSRSWAEIEDGFTAGNLHFWLRVS